MEWTLVCSSKIWFVCTNRIADVLEPRWSAFDFSDSNFLLLVSGNEVKKKFQLESGIHRVQRVPDTEANGRRHTSTIAIAVLPCLSEQEMKIPQHDLKIEFVRGSGPGGQHRNKTETGVRITHIPTKITAYSCTRSQYSNRKNAMAVLLARINEVQKSESDSKINEQRREQIRDMGRGVRVRTYNFIQDRTSDERVGKQFRTSDIMKGKLDLIYKEFEGKNLTP